jgi:hypothetical protein
MLLENYQYLNPAIATHNVRSIAHTLAAAGVSSSNTRSFQMLYGMGTPSKQHSSNWDSDCVSMRPVASCSLGWATSCVGSSRIPRMSRSYDKALSTRCHRRLATEPGGRRANGKNRA